MIGHKTALPNPKGVSKASLFQPNARAGAELDPRVSAQSRTVKMEPTNPQWAKTQDPNDEYWDYVACLHELRDNLEHITLARWNC